MNNFTKTAQGDCPHLYHRGRHYPIAVRIGDTKSLPVADTNKEGFGFYALPGGGKATAAEIKATL